VAIRRPRVSRFSPVSTTSVCNVFIAGEHIKTISRRLRGTRPDIYVSYDQSAAIRPQNTTTVRSNAKKPYDANSAILTITKKSVTFKAGCSH
jgi:hypothetical protein